MNDAAGDVKAVLIMVTSELLLATVNAIIKHVTTWPSERLMPRADEDPTKTISWRQLVGLTFFAVCGGDYGIEDTIGAAGARLTLAGLIQSHCPPTKNLIRMRLRASKTIKNRPMSRRLGTRMRR